MDIMSRGREERDWWDREVFGSSQEWIDRMHQLEEEWRAFLGPRLAKDPDEWAELESDSDYDDSHLAPLSPPPTPKDEGLAQPMSMHAPTPLPTSTPPRKQRSRGKKRRPAVTASSGEPR